MNQGSSSKTIMLFASILDIDTLLGEVTDAITAYKSAPSTETLHRVHLTCALVLSKQFVKESGSLDIALKQVDDRVKIEKLFDHTKNQS